MAEIKNNIYEIEPEGLSGFVGITEEDVKLISSAQISKTFKPNDNFIELSYFSLDNTRLTTIPNYTNYSILSGDGITNTQGNSEVSIDIEQDYIGYGFLGTDVKALYNFLDYPYSTTNTPQDFYIESISPDRTEIRLISVNLTGETISTTTDTLIAQYNTGTYTPDFHIYLGDNIYYSIVNIDKEQFRDTTAVLIKLYSPLPTSINTKVRLNIVEKIGNSIAYEINSIITPEQPVIPTLRGANFDVEVEVQATEPSEYYNYNELFSFPTNNTYRELNSLFNQKGAELGIDYSNFSNFINFSSAQERLLNFRYKLDLIESYQGSLDSINSVTYSGTGITGSRQYYENLIKGVVNNLDHYERHLYFESGSTSWPKTNSTKPYINQISSTNEATAWYNTEIQDAVLYDAQNPDILTNSIPAYLKEDTDNRPYELFIHMIAQHFDNLWLYTNAVSKKYDADNRLNRGVSKDLVEDLLRNFGVKLYTSNKSADDLFRYFTANSYNFLEESIPGGIITSGQKEVSQNDYQKEIYKRIYHNLPLLMKSKGTERGLRALINCFGIPSDILKIKIYGGQSANNLPFFGGEQAWTGSLDKVRTNNTGSIVSGDTLSFYTSISNTNNEYTQDLHRIEVGFSPTDNIDNYIVSQSAVLFPDSSFNIDDYVGDPRESLTNRYAGLYSYSKTILNDLDSYNVKDFIRLIKFFDNVIFRMVRDFIPARAVADTGIIIKPHLLERNKAISPVMTWTRPEYSGSITTAFISGSNAGAFASIANESVENESVTKYWKIVKTPVGDRYKYVNEFNTGTPQIEKSFEEAKFDGELNNSQITITNGELNRGNLYKQIEYPTITYKVQFWTDIPGDICILEVPNSEFIIRSSNEIINLPISNLFTGDTANAYTYLVDGNAPNVSEFEHRFEGGQYDTFTITTEHNDNPIANTKTGETTCQGSRDLRVVLCELNTQPQGQYPSQITINTPYNLYDWFVDRNNPPINTKLKYFIGNTQIGSTDNGEYDTGVNPTNYIFSDPNSSTVVVSVTDFYDTSCRINLQLDFNLCTLSEITTLITLPIVPVDGDVKYAYPFSFSGTSSTTSYQFRIRVEVTVDGRTTSYGPGPFLDITTPVTGKSNGAPSSISTNYANIISTYPTANPSGTPPTEVGGIYDNSNFKRYIQFKAINNEECIAESKFYLLSDEALIKREVTMSFYASNVPTAANPFCAMSLTNINGTPVNTVKVYVLVPSTVSTVDAFTVLNQLLPIYLNNTEGDTTPAAQGIYGTATTGRKGRRWIEENGIRFWDTEYNTQEQELDNYLYTDGLILCGGGRDGIGISDEGDRT